MNRLSKKQWDKVKLLLRKSISKDSTNASARYVFALYFFTQDNPEFQVDSAYSYVTGSLRDLSQSAARERDKLKKLPLDSAILVSLRQRIDSAAFTRARMQNSEQAYQSFLERFSHAHQREEAVTLRDEAA